MPEDRYQRTITIPPAAIRGQPRPAAASPSTPPVGRGRQPSRPKPGWLIIQTSGRVWGGRFKSRGQAIRQADRDRSFTTATVLVKHSRTGETWKRRGGAWFKFKEAKGG